jgi:hypothetical protein
LRAHVDQTDAANAPVRGGPGGRIALPGQPVACRITPAPGAPARAGLAAPGVATWPPRWRCPVGADRNLLFGVLALQADLQTPARFAEACSAWAARKDTPLAYLLVERGWLSPADRADVDRLLQRKLAKYAGDARASLAEVATDSVKRSLAAIEDADVRQSLAGLSPPPKTAHVLLSTTDHLPETRERYTLSRLHATGGIGRVWLARDASLVSRQSPIDRCLVVNLPKFLRNSLRLTYQSEIDRILGRDVALKELRPERAGNPAVWDRFLKEARVTGQLEHPGVVPIYEVGRRPDDRSPFYTMRFVRGRTLAEAIRTYHQRQAQGEAGPLELRVGAADGVRRDV